MFYHGVVVFCSKRHRKKRYFDANMYDRKEFTWQVRLVELL